MSKKIKISTSGLIVFMGSMNAMPMMYAWELKKAGYDVLYFVDVPRRNTLSRPENHFPEIAYPYPEWIIELNLPTQMLLPYFSFFHAKRMMRQVRGYSKKPISCFVLNGFFTSLSPWLKAYGPVAALSHGSDLDVWANKAGAEHLAKSFGRRSVFKYLPDAVSRKLITLAVQNQYRGYSQSNAVVYFPAGFNDVGDRVINSLAAEGVSIFERYDISFEPLKNVSRDFKEPNEVTVIFSGVRFLYETFPDGNIGYSKGNDVIIRGLAAYYRRNKNIEVHFVEKGEDVQAAKRLCVEVGLDKVVVWHKEMPFKELIEHYIKADICFDQLGSHWLGAVGAYALFLGKPLIANVASAVRSNVLPNHNPILSADSADSVFHAMVVLENIELRKNIYHSGRCFVEAHMSAQALINKLFFFENPCA